MVLRLLTLFLLGCTGAFAATTQPAAPDPIADRAAGKVTVELFVPAEPLFPPAGSRIVATETHVVVKIVNGTDGEITMPFGAVPHIVPQIDPYRPTHRNRNWWLLILIQPPREPGITGLGGAIMRPLTLAPHSTTLSVVHFILRESPAGSTNSEWSSGMTSESSPSPRPQ